MALTDASGALVNTYHYDVFGAMRVASPTSGLHTLSVTKVSNLTVPLPPLPEQHRIVAEVERRLSVVEALEGAVANGLKRAHRLRQSIRKRAFEVRLVRRDPYDEPASVLLERIRAEREKAAPSRPPRRRAAVSGRQPAPT